jgi:hypothetical protein
VQQLEEVI